ncbi:MAG: PLP-dependent aspartate aminotransferase family protein [bacterium]|nr:PLP-dependent aspartate aminotransferase family protein [bacterium]
MKGILNVPAKWAHLRPQTLEVLRARIWHDPREDKFRALAPPEKGLTGEVYTSTAYTFEKAKDAGDIFGNLKHGYAYPRVSLGTPPIQQLSEKLLDMELGQNNLQRDEYGVLLTASGMSAILLLVLSMADNGGEFISSPYLYGGTYHLFDESLNRLRIKCHFIKDPLCSSDWEMAILRHPKARFIYAEDDANPMLIKLNNHAIATIAHSHGKPYFCDRTVGTAILQKPLLSGVDGVVHSASKNIGGHSAGLGGAIIARKEIIDKIKDDWFVVVGAVMDPRVADYMLAGLETLEERMKIKIESARQIVDFLRPHPKVRKVYWSGTDLLSFELRGRLEDAERLVESTKIIFLAPHLGDDYPLVIHPASTTHAKVPAKERVRLGITDTLVRLSVGLFDPQDVIDDLEQALRSIS